MDSCDGLLGWTWLQHTAALTAHWRVFVRWLTSYALLVMPNWRNMSSALIESYLCGSEAAGKWAWVPQLSLMATIPPRR